MEKKPLVSVVVPVGPGMGTDIIVDSIRKSRYPRDMIELIVAEGKNPARQRNEGVKRATGEIICFFDDDTILAPETIGELVDGLGRGEDVAVVGGPNLTPESDNFFQRVTGHALSSFFGAAKMRMRYKAHGKQREATETDLILCNLAVRKKDFNQVGGFNESLWPNEENVFFNDVRKGGKKLMYNPSAVAYHSRRKNVRTFAKQVFGYGRGRMEQTLLQPRSLQPIFFFPSLFVLYLALLPLFASAPPYLYVLWAYLIVNVIASLTMSAKVRDALTAFVLPFIYIIIHVAYGLGFMYGLKKLFVRKALPREVKFREVKI